MDSGFLILAGALFAITGIGVYFGAQRLEDFFSAPRFRADSEPEGAPRSIFYVFYMLIAWACLVFLLPLSIGYSIQLEQNARDLLRLAFNLVEILIGPLIVLLLLLYGIRRGFLSWVKEISWPNERKDHGGK